MRSCVTSRLYTAIAAGCIPVALCDRLNGGFKEQANYSSFWVRLPARSFQREPLALLRTLRQMPRAEVAERQRNLAAHRADVLYEAEDTRTGTNFLASAAACSDTLSQEHEARRRAHAAGPRERAAGSGGGAAGAPSTRRH